MATFFRLLTVSVFISILCGVGFLASAQNPGNLTVSLFATIIGLSLVWLLAASFAFLSGLSLYSPRNRPGFHLFSNRVFIRWNPSKFHVLGYAATSYATTIYVFAIIFLLISKYDDHAFAPAIDTLANAAYFSVVTIATVGYGDISPASGWARLTASAEIIVGVVYGVFFLSVIAGFLRER